MCYFFLSVNIFILMSRKTCLSLYTTCDERPTLLPISEGNPERIFTFTRQKKGLKDKITFCFVVGYNKDCVQSEQLN